MNKIYKTNQCRINRFYLSSQHFPGSEKTSEKIKTVWLFLQLTVCNTDIEEDNKKMHPVELCIKGWLGTRFVSVSKTHSLYILLIKKKMMTFKWCDDQKSFCCGD